MKIGCIKCQSRFQLDSDRISENGSMVRCLNCSYIFMVYPPDYYGSPVVQETNIEQEILDDLFEMHGRGSEPRIRQNRSEDSRFIVVDNLNTMEHIREEDLNPNDAEYAELPDLSELEKIIDWDDIDDRNDLEVSPTKSNYNPNDTQELDINRI